MVIFLFIERRARVRRGGTTLTVAVRDIVPGDIVLLSAGDMIPGDGYFIRAESVAVDESAMTGETAPQHLAMAFALVVLYFASTEAAKLLFYRYWGSSGGARRLTVARPADSLTANGSRPGPV